MTNADGIDFRAGAYRTCITPPIGIPIEGSFHLNRATHVLDDLYVNALVLSDGKCEVALVSVDVCQMPDHVHAEVGAAITALTGIARGHQLVTSTHTHNGPTLGGVVVTREEVWADYVSLLVRQIATAVAMAQRGLQPARVGAASGSNPRHVFNRRLRHPEGGIIMNWFDKARVAGLEPAGPVDPTLAMIKVARPDGSPLAFVVNYALHNNAASAAPYSSAISADFSGVLGDTLRQVYGPETVTLFLPSAMGDINWIDPNDPHQDRAQLYRQIGRSLAGSVMQLDQDIAYATQPRLGIQRRTLTMPERPWDEAWLWDYRVFQLETERNTTSNPFYEAYQTWLTAGAPPLPDHTLDLGLLTVGDDIALVTNPTEFFVELGLEVRAASPYPHTLIATLTNGNAGYVPTRRAFAEGGYEVKKYPANSFLAIEAGELIVAESVRMLRSGG